MYIGGGKLKAVAKMTRPYRYVWAAYMSIDLVCGGILMHVLCMPI